MENCKLEVSGNELVIRIDLAARGGKSKSGKSVTVASTSGATEVPGHPEIKLNLNAYTKG